MKNNFNIVLFLIATLIFSSCKNAEEKLYESSKLANTSIVYKEYINKYPEGEFLKEITDSFKLREEEDVFANAKSKNTISEYSDYLEKYPNGRFVNEVKDSLNGKNTEKEVLVDGRDSKKHTIFTVKLIEAICVDFCHYYFEDVSTGENINFSWNVEWDKQNGSTYPDLDNESAKIMNFIENCAQDFYSYGTKSSNCKEVLGKTFVVKAIKKTREEVIATGPETFEKTGKIEVYYEVTNIRIK